MALTTVRPQGMGFNTGRRNLVKNGAMLVSQRGTSFTSVADNAYTLDRYRLTENTSAIVDMSQSSEVPSEGGLSKSLKIDITTSATPSGGQAFCLNYRMEGYDFLPSGYGNSNAKYLTLSFWVKSNVTGTYRLTFIARNGSGNRSIGATYTINSADTWEKKEVSIIPDTASTPYQTTDEGFRIEWYLASGPDRTTGSLPTSWATLDNATRATGQGVNLASSTSNEWYITGVQLEVGTNASDFEHRSYADELFDCSRYYTNLAQFNGDNFGQMYSGTQGKVGLKYPRVMRAAPTVTANSPFTSLVEENGVAVRTPTAVAVNYSRASGCIMSFDVTGTSGNGLFVRQATNDTTIEADAEL